MLGRAEPGVTDGGQWRGQLGQARAAAWQGSWPPFPEHPGASLTLGAGEVGMFVSLSDGSRDTVRLLRLLRGLNAVTRVPASPSLGAVRQSP